MSLVVVEEKSEDGSEEAIEGELKATAEPG
jgi:hypothetical protein